MSSVAANAVKCLVGARMFVELSSRARAVCVALVGVYLARELGGVAWPALLKGCAAAGALGALLWWDATLNERRSCAAMEAAEQQSAPRGAAPGRRDRAATAAAHAPAPNAARSLGREATAEADVARRRRQQGDAIEKRLRHEAAMSDTRSKVAAVLDAARARDAAGAT